MATKAMEVSGSLSKRARGSVDGEGAFKTRDQAIHTHRLGQEGEGAALQCRLAHVLVGMRRHDDGGNAMASADQLLLQVNAARTGHAHVRDQAHRVANLWRLKKFLGRFERRCGVPMGFQKARSRL